MDVNSDWKDDVMYQLNEAIRRGNVDKETIELMKALLKGAKVRASMTEYFKDQE